MLEHERRTDRVHREGMGEMRGIKLAHRLLWRKARTVQEAAGQNDLVDPLLVQVACRGSDARLR